MKEAMSLCFALMASLSTFLGAQARADSPNPQAAPLDLEQQVLSQGPMLLGNLRQAREAGLQRDRWGMTYSLKEARRVLDAISAAERSIRPEGAPGTDQPPSGTPPRELTAPLGQPLELDRPEPAGREQSVERFEAVDGSIPLELVSKDIDRALAALNAHPRALGAALLATEDALRQVHRNNRLEPKDWTSVRNQVLQGYALALDSRPGASKQLAEAQRALSAMSGGEPFAQRLAALQAAQAPDPAVLSALVHDLDAKVSSLREAAQVAH